MMGGALQDLASILMEEKRYEQADLDEVNITHLVELNWGQENVLVVGTVDILPAPSGEPLPWEELAVEILEAVHAADDLRQRYGLQAAVAFGLGRYALPHLMIGDEVSGASGDDGAHIGQEAALPRSLEILADFTFKGLAHFAALATVGARRRAGSTSSRR